MKRRGFLGFAAGAAVAGPGMAKQALASTMSELSSLQLSGGALSGLGYASTNAAKQAGMFDSISQVTRAQDMLAKIAGLTPATRAKYKSRTGVHQLDPDIASYRSIALHAKIDWQKERNLDVALNDRKSWWQRIASGLDPYAPQDEELF